MQALPDGRYDVFIVEAETIDATTMRVELAVVSGDDKGNVVAMRGPHLARDPIELLGLPATLHVHRGVLRLEVER